MSLVAIYALPDRAFVAPNVRNALGLSEMASFVESSSSIPALVETLKSVISGDWERIDDAYKRMLGKSGRRSEREFVKSCGFVHADLDVVSGRIEFEPARQDVTGFVGISDIPSYACDFGSSDETLCAVLSSALQASLGASGIDLDPGSEFAWVSRP